VRTKKKPPIVAIRGTYSRDIIMQAELHKLSMLQDSEWHASRAAQKAALEIEARIAHGATIEDGGLGFDGHRNMARTREAQKKRGTG
jgi:hypothetical protein